MAYERPYNETLPRTPENVKQAERWATEKAKALGLPTPAEKKAAREAAEKKVAVAREAAAKAGQPAIPSTVKKEDEQAAE